MPSRRLLSSSPSSEGLPTATLRMAFRRHASIAWRRGVRRAARSGCPSHRLPDRCPGICDHGTRHQRLGQRVRHGSARRRREDLQARAVRQLLRTCSHQRRQALVGLPGIAPARSPLRRRRSRVLRPDLRFRSICARETPLRRCRRQAAAPSISPSRRREELLQPRCSIGPRQTRRRCGGNIPIDMTFTPCDCASYHVFYPVRLAVQPSIRGTGGVDVRVPPAAESPRLARKRPG